MGGKLSNIINPKFSVIIPVYNTEKYIGNCIEKLLNQNYDNYEIILVDDGSVDKSSVICDEYAMKYSWINVIHQRNKGASAARNKGISIAKGKYVMFCDADDYFGEETLRILSTMIDIHSPDCVCFGWQYITSDGIQPGKATGLPKNQLLDRQYIYDYILPPLLNLKKDEERFIYDFAWNKVYRNDILKEHNIVFDETRRTWEDRPFVINYLRQCQNFLCMPDYMYNYVQVPGSLSLRYTVEFFDIILSNYNKYVDWFEDIYDFNIDYVYSYWSHSIENMIKRSLRETPNEDIYNSIIEALSNEQVQEWFNKRRNDKEESKQIAEYVINREYNKVIDFYKCQIDKEIRQDKINEIKHGFKAAIRRLLGL